MWKAKAIRYIKSRDLFVAETFGLPHTQEPQQFFMEIRDLIQ
jgi:hypothetical protein